MGLQETWAKILGVVLILVGLAGFFTGDMLLWFGINGLHNVVHLVTGLIFAWAGFSSLSAKAVNTWLGGIYVLVAIVGFFGVLSFLNVNMADNLLHLVIGVVTIGIGMGAE